MTKNKINTVFVLALISILCSGCDNFFGKKTNLDFIPTSNGTKNSVAYIPIQPTIKDLQYPTDVIVGWDQLIYVADAGSHKIMCYDISGDYMSSFYVPGLKSVAQDRHLNLMAIGAIDTLINGKYYTLSTLFRINLDNPGGYGLQNARIINKIIHPFYIRSGLADADTLTSFQHIAFLADNSYYVTRTGPNTSITQIGGPDDAVIQFSASDQFLTPIQVTTSSGQYANYFQMPMGIATLAQPPQSNTGVSSSGAFIFTCSASYYPLKVQVIAKEETPNGIFYFLDYFPIGDTTKANGFLYTPYKFNQPTAVTLTGDGTNYIFVVDAGTDSLYQFNSTGDEGVTPPAAYTSRKNIKVSFGGKGTDFTHFDRPMGVAYFNKTVYVADAGNGRVLRFKLTTDIQ